jgi:DNA-binding MarR family transcriptional regulator
MNIIGSQVAKKEGVTGKPNFELHRFITFRIARLHAKLNIQAARILQEKADLTLTKWRVISLIGNLGETNSAELVRISAMDKGLLSRRLKSLIDEGLVLSDIDKTDSRVHPLRLSAKGKALFDATQPHMRARQKGINAHLTEEEVETLFQIFDKLDRAAEIDDFDS